MYLAARIFLVLENFYIMKTYINWGIPVVATELNVMGGA